ncbi:MAG: PAS domain S-box protein [Chthoniobacterales bacterium]
MSSQERSTPLALFLDDLQWLDAATLNFFENLVSHPDVRHLLLIGAYRDNEVSPSHPLMLTLDAIRKTEATVRHIVLAPLSLHDLDQLIADSLHQEGIRTKPLARLVHEKTAGNPFFAIQFLNTLAEEGLLEFDRHEAAWRWDINQISAKRITDNVVDFMVEKLNRLPDTAREALKKLACLGNTTKAADLAMLHGASSEEVQSDLWEAVNGGFVVRLAGSYNFVHDRVQEAAYSLIPEDERAAAHLRIGRLLLSNTASEEREDRIFEIVNQFNCGAELLVSTEERERVAELNLIAGRRAQAASAHASALTYLSAGGGLLAPESWERQYELTFALELHRAESEFVTGHLEAAEERLSMLSRRSRSIVDDAAVTCLRLDLYTTLDRSDRAVEVCLQYLRRLSVTWSPHPTEKEVLQEYEHMWCRIGSRSIEALVDLPPMTDPAWRATMDVLTKGMPPAMFTDKNLQCLILARMANLSLEHGNCDGSCLGYVWLGGVLGASFGDYRTGFRFGKLGVDLMENRGLNRFKARVYLGFGCLVNPWTQHMRTGLAPMRRALVAAQEAGDLTYAAYACYDLIGQLLPSGEPLGEVQREAENALELAKKARFGLMVDGITGQLRLIRTLRGLTPKFGSFDDEQFDEVQFERHLESSLHLANPACRYWIRKLQARFYAADEASAIEAATKAERLLWAMPPTIEVPDYHFHAALARARRYDVASASEQTQHLEALVAHHKQLTVWAENCPENFGNRTALVGAEIARIEGRELDAMRLYEQAVKSAGENGFVHNEGIANEMAGRFYLGRSFETIGHTYLRNARSCYLRWGARGKVKQFDQLYPELNEQAPLGLTITTGVPIEQLDLVSVVKAMQAVSCEIDLGKLIEILMVIAVECAGAERGLLFLPSGQEHRIVAEAATRGDKVQVMLAQAFVTPPQFPESILRYVIRTRDSVILDNASTENPFSDDDYVRAERLRSILCLPLVKMSALIGVLYLENNLTPRVFTSGRHAVVELLASQAAISLENARLYADLRQENCERSKVEEALRGSEERMNLAAEAANLAMWEWDVSKDEIWMTDKGRALFGFGSDERLDNEALVARVHPEDRAARNAAITRALETRGEYATDYRVLLPDGTQRWIGARGHCTNVGDTKGVRLLGVSMDVTAQKAAQDALRESEARFRTMANTAPVMIWMAGTDKLCTFFNKGWLEFTGRTLEQELGNGWAEGVHCEDFDRFFEVYVSSFDARQPFTIEYRLRRNDGEYRWVLDSEAPRFASDGTFLGYIGSCVDITERKQAQDRFRLVVEASPNGIVVVDAQGHIVLVNARAEKLFGYGREELVGQGIETLVPEQFRGEYAAHRAGFDGAPAARAMAGLELFARRKDGTEFPAEIGMSPIQSPEGTLVLSVIEDITERRQAEAKARKHREELAHLSRVAIMGEMAGALAHELNQPLTGIVNNASAGRRFITKGRADLPKLDGLFEAVVEDGRRAGEIIRGIRGMVHKSKEVRSPVNLNDIIAGVLRLVRSEALERRCLLVTEPDPELPLVEADRVQLQQVLVNLAVNAFEAMRETPPGKRRVIIRSERESEDRVRVSVRDFGTGLPVEEPERIFERFFSTKRDGMGMGLAIARSIIASHGGELAATNAEGGGACVHFSLPIITKGQ